MLYTSTTIYYLAITMSLKLVKRVVPKVKREREKPVKERAENLWKSPMEDWDPQE